MNNLTNFEEEIDSEESENDNFGDFKEYDISSSPNDFNVKTLFDFIDSGVVKIPGFQRNYVWDIKRASKLIESILIGIPIPQIFLYEQAKNKFIVIDGQQRYMTIYYFIKKRFPKDGKRLELRNIFDSQKGIPENILSDDNFFTNFNLKLPANQQGLENKFNKLNYDTLEEEDKISFELRTIRNIIIKQSSPDDGNSAVFEIFNRLNSGGVNLKPQEIRTSLFHSDFYDMLYRINLNKDWRKLTSSDPDLHMKDVEILLRGFAMLLDGDKYKPSMTRFLNKFSCQAKLFDNQKIQKLENIFLDFINKISIEDDKIFFSKKNRFNISVYESIFAAICSDALTEKNIITNVNYDLIQNLKDDADFNAAILFDTASEKNVKLRIKRAKEILLTNGAS